MHIHVETLTCTEKIMQKTIETRTCTDQIMHIQEERHTCTGKSTYLHEEDTRIQAKHTPTRRNMHVYSQNHEHALETRSCTEKIMQMYV